MALEVGIIIAGIDLVIGITILILAGITAQRTRGSALYWASALLLVTGLVYVAHAAVEVSGLGEGLYGVTALIATILLAFTLVMIDITTQMLGVKA